MGGDDDRAILTGQPSQEIAELAAARGVERRRRLIHQEQRRVDRERARDRHALRFPTRELARQRLLAVLDAERAQQLARAALRFRQRDAVRVHRREPHVLERRQVLEQVMKLEDEADLAAKLAQRRRRDGRAAVERHLVDRDAAGIERFEPRDRSEHRRLARSRRSHDRDQRPARHVEGHAR